MSAGARPLIHRMRPGEGEPQGALVLFHGRGTSEDDLFPLLEALDPRRRLTGVTPRGPLSLPPGGWHWYAVRRVGYPDRGTFLAAFEQTAAFVDALPELVGVPLERTVLGGFSQGAVMAYALALGSGRPRPAGIIALSGFIPSVDGFAFDLENLQGFPVAMTHGSLDPVIGVDFGRQAHARLDAAGARVDYREAPIGHQIDPAWIPALAGWVRQVVVEDPRPSR